MKRPDSREGVKCKSSESEFYLLGQWGAMEGS